MFHRYPDVMTVEQVSAALHIGKNKTYELIHDGSIPCKRIGRKILVPKLYLIDYIRAGRYNKAM